MTSPIPLLRVSRPSSLALAVTSPAETSHFEAPPTYLESQQKQHHSKICAYLVNVLTCLYALIIAIIGLIMEISPQWREQIPGAEVTFFFYMYGSALFYFTFFYLFFIYTTPYNYCIRLAQKFDFIAHSDGWFLEPVAHTGEGAGTLYLRLGAMLFGVVGLVLHGLELCLCIKTYSCDGVFIAKDVVVITFVFLQMHFLFCNTKMTFPSFPNICKLGLMHLAAVNIWTWFRYVLAKQTTKANKSSKAKKYEEDSSSSSSSEEDMLTIDHGDLTPIINETIATVVDTLFNTTNEPNTTVPVKPQLRLLITLEHFGGIGTILTTCIVEFSLIGAAVMFILWKSINHVHHTDSQTTKRKHSMRVDCSSSSAGLFMGTALLVGVIIGCGMYGILESLDDVQGAWLTFGIVELAMFVVTTLACFLGFWSMRLLQYRLHAHGEVIDEILLIFGLFGELVYCTIGIDMFIYARRELGCYEELPLFVFGARFIQVIVQTAFILTASRLRCLSTFAVKNKPGKQIITFLLLTNITLFILHTYESTKSTFGIHYDISSIYTSIIYAIGPLLIFFRFHSSACLAEIWKITYSTKISHTHLTPTPSLESNLTTASSTPEELSHRRAEHFTLQQKLE